MTAPILIIFGITGDLSKRKLLPALYHIFSQGLIPPETKIIGVSRHPLNIDELLSSIELCVLAKDKVCDPSILKLLRQAIDTFKLDPSKPEDYKLLQQKLDNIDTEKTKKMLFYMSIPPSAYAPIVDNLGKVGLNHERCRLVLEKPFGYDLQSAKELITLADKSFSEHQIYRTDHYLAKETAQNLLTFRLYNPIFSTLWNAAHIESVHIRAIEKINIEGRKDFYENTGALRDLIQSHLMQLLALSLMDLPSNLSSDQIHKSKQDFLEQLMPADPALALRAQYDSYTREVDNPKSSVETFVRLHLKHASSRWQGVDIILETGKALNLKDTSITVKFKTPANHPNNNLHFAIQPDEGITLDLVVKEPGFAGHIINKSLSFDYKKSFLAQQHIDAYERVIIDSINGDQALFASAGEVLATWHVLQPLLDAWQKEGAGGLVLYPNGSTPSEII